MKRAIALAEMVRGKTRPNPWVGAVIVKNGVIVGEGATQKAGSHHAEIMALGEAGDKSKGATLYVTLEPCSHFGKTPPCVDAIISSGIEKVVVGVLDPNPQVNGRGIQALQACGIEVTTGVCEAEIANQLAIFFTFITQKIPYVFVKTATCKNDCITHELGKSRKISGDISHNFVHTLRGKTDAIMVGTNTLKIDNPALTCRNGGPDPLRIIFDLQLVIPLSARVYKDSNALVCVCKNSAQKSIIEHFKKNKIDYIELVPNKEGKIAFKDLLFELGKRDIMSLMVEGGENINSQLLQENVIDCVYHIQSQKLHFTDAPKIFHISQWRKQFHKAEEKQLGEDILTIWKKKGHE